MNIAIIDADLIGRTKHRFPNLVCMKLSAYYKSKGHDVRLVTDYSCLDDFDKIFISKVFTDTPIDEAILQRDNVEYGGTGFFYDKAPKLPEEIHPPCPAKGRNVTQINGKVYIDGYEYKKGKWRKTFKALWHLWF